jgi:hypothetical protein
MAYFKGKNISLLKGVFLNFFKNKNLIYGKMGQIYESVFPKILLELFSSFKNI